MGGSMGSVVGEKVTLAAEAALDERVPLIVVSASGGARMQEGTLALMQLAKTVRRARSGWRDAGVPYISLLTDPTTGGVFASFAALGDVNLAEPRRADRLRRRARRGRRPPARRCPDGFQRAEFLFSHGFVDQVVPRGELARPARRTCSATCRPAAAGGATPDPGAEAASGNGRAARASLAFLEVARRAGACP